MGELSNWAKKQSKSLILDDGETIEAVYEGYKIAPNPFDSEKELAFYRLTVTQDGQSVVKIFKSGSGKTARFFDELKVGQSIRMTRHGKGSDTKYAIEVVNGSSSMSPMQAGEHDDDQVPF